MDIYRETIGGIMDMGFMERDTSPPGVNSNDLLSTPIVFLALLTGFYPLLSLAFSALNFITTFPHPSHFSPTSMHPTDLKRISFGSIPA